MRVSDTVGTFAVVFILPEDVNITAGSPRSHRNFLDIYISQLSHPYLRSLIEYQKTLKQRNALLKKIKERKTGTSHLDAWDDGFIRRAIEIMKIRNEFVLKIRQGVRELSSRLSGSRDEISVAYKPRLQSGDYDNLAAALALLRSGRERDLRVGASLIGPHRDGLEITIGGRPLRKYGSLGQKKSVMIAMKLATLDILSKGRGERAILVMDEALAELDVNRAKTLLNLLSGGGQVFLASAAMTGLNEAAMRVFDVNDGSVGRREV